MKMKGGCGVHPKNEDWLYVERACAKLCLGCLKDGLYSEECTAEARVKYPSYFADTTQHVEDKND